MEWEIVLWILLFFTTLTLIAINVYQMVILSDLGSDHMNPYEASAKINAVVVPEFVLHGAVCVLFLLTRHWFMFLLTLPVACFNLMLFMKRRHHIEVIEAFRYLHLEKTFRIAKLVFYVIFFVIILFRS